MREKKKIADESVKTRKAREKLTRQLEEQDLLMTKEALEEKAAEIHRWIARHAHHRVVLKEKTISLFDENQNAASLSQKIAAIAAKLSEDMHKVFSAEKS